MQVFMHLSQHWKASPTFRTKDTLSMHAYMLLHFSMSCGGILTIFTANFPCMMDIGVVQTEFTKVVKTVITVMTRVWPIGGISWHTSPLR